MAMLKKQRILSVSQVTPPLPTPCRCRTVAAGAAGESRLLHLCRHRLSGGWPCLRLQRRWRLRGILGISRHGWCPLKCPTCPTLGLQNYPVTGLNSKQHSETWPGQEVRLDCRCLSICRSRRRRVRRCRSRRP